MRSRDVSSKRIGQLILSFIWMFVIVVCLTSITICIIISQGGFLEQLEQDAAEDVFNLTLEANSIFFLDTELYGGQRTKFQLSRRQACSVESAARTNPNRTIYVLHVSKQMLNCKEKNRTAACALTKYDNVRFVYLNAYRFLSGTPAQDLIRQLLVSSSLYTTTHLSDLLRFTVLSRWGGIYFDTDVLVLKHFDDIAENFVGFESDDRVGSAVIGFSRDGKGHLYAEWCMKDYVEKYDAENREANGPDLLQRFVTFVCGENGTVPGKTCENLTMYKQNYFYPVRYQDWSKYFYESVTQKQINRLKKSHAIHLWNYFSERSLLSLKSNSAYVVLAKEFCPEVINRLDDEVL